MHWLGSKALCQYCVCCPVSWRFKPSMLCNWVSTENKFNRRVILILFLGVHIINLRKTWEKLLLAARIIVGIENPADVCVISARPYGQVNLEHYTGLVQCLEFLKKVLKFAPKFSRPGKSLENVV